MANVALWTVAELADELPVDLDDVDQQPLQVRRRPVAGCEVIDRNAYTKLAQARKVARRCVGLRDAPPSSLQH